MLDAIEMPSEHAMGRRKSREGLVARPILERRLTRQASRGEMIGAPTPYSGITAAATEVRRRSLTRGSLHFENGFTNGTNGHAATIVRERILTRQASKEVIDETIHLRRERGFSRTFSQELTSLSTQLTRQRLLSRTFSQEDLDEHLPILLRSLRELLKDDKEVIRRDDEFLTKFLRVKNYKVERAHALVKSYYHQIKRNQDIIQNIRPSQCASFYNENMAVLLKEKGRDGSAVIFVRLGMWDTKKYSLHQAMQALLFLAEQALCDREWQLNGITAIVDLKNLGLSHVRQLTPKEIKRMICGVQDGFPLKIAGLHIINHPYIFWSVFYVAQRLLKEKLRQRIHLHSDFASLQAHFNPGTLPTCVGGPIELQDAIDHSVTHQLLKEDRLYSEFYS